MRFTFERPKTLEYSLYRKEIVLVGKFGKVKVFNRLLTSIRKKEQLAISSVQANRPFFIYE